MKNVKKYIKLYYEKSEQPFAKQGYYYPPRNWKDFEDWTLKTFQKHLQDEKKYEEKKYVKPYLKTSLYLALLSQSYYFGYLIAFEKMDYEILNNVIFQNTRRTLLKRSMAASGTDHCNVLFDVLSAFACNDFEVIESFFPKELPLAKGTYSTENSVNLIHVLYYKQHHLANSAIEKANKFLNKKISSLDKYVVKYFIALYNRDLPETNFCLQELCKAYQRQGYPTDKIDKCFANEIHGLYRFARIIDNDFFNKIELPKHDSFFIDFEIWQKENSFPKGNIFYKYPSEMNYMNKIFEAEIPKMTLKEYKNGNRKELYKDVETFGMNLHSNVLKIEE